MHGINRVMPTRRQRIWRKPARQPQDARLLFERDLLDKLTAVEPEKRLAPPGGQSHNRLETR